jgi:hypothetical protein
VGGSTRATLAENDWATGLNLCPREEEFSVHFFENLLD